LSRFWARQEAKSKEGLTMLVYVAHRYGGDPANIERAKKITHDLQVTDLDNCYICPLLAFSHLKYGEIQYENEIALCFDILEMCDKLIVASEVSQGVKLEIELAEGLKNSNGEPMEVVYLADKYRTL
jgi:hypothetical protein